VPDFVRPLAQLNALQLVLASRVEDAQIYFVGVSREDGEIDAFAVPGCAAGVWLTRPHRRDRTAVERRHGTMGGGFSRY
jgi:hypothetical protein